MIKIKRSIFSEHDPMLPPEKQFRADPKVEKEYGVNLKIVVHMTKKFETDFSSHYSIEKKTIRNLKKDILNGHIYSDGPAGGDTHYLSKFSKKDKLHSLSKSINTVDRFNYLVYPPYLEETGELEYKQDIVLSSCKGHYRLGVGNYSETENN